MVREDSNTRGVTRESDGPKLSAEDWFLEYGLPAFVSAHKRKSDFVARTAPLSVFVVVSQVALLVASALVSHIVRSPQFDFLDAYLTDAATSELPQGSTVAELIALSTLVVPILGLIGAVFAAWWTSRTDTRNRKLIGAIALFLFVFAPVLARLFADFSGVFSSSPWRIAGWMGIRLSALLVAYFGLRIGAGSVLSFAWRRAREEVSAMAPLSAKALPLLVLALLFAFFSAETWQVAVGLSSARLLAVVGILVILALVLVISTTVERVESAAEQGVESTRAIHLLQDTPFAGASGKLAKGAEDVGLVCVLSRAERFNLVLVQAAVQLWQSLAFAAVVFVFLVGFSVAAIPGTTEAQWTQISPGYLVINEIRLPITLAYLKVSALLAAVSVLSFAGSSATSDSFTQSFMQTLHDEVDRAIAIKASLRAGSHSAR